MCLLVFCLYCILSVPLLIFLPVNCQFIPHDVMRKWRSLLSPSVRPSVCLSVTFVYCIKPAKDIVKLLFRPGSTVILVFLTPSSSAQIQGEPLQRGAQNKHEGKILRFLTEIDDYLGNGTR